MKCLCVCQYGHSRSVALTRVLHHEGHHAVAVGWQTSGTSLSLLAAWADKIFVLEGWFAKFVPEEHRHKVVAFDVGPDRWSNPYHPDLSQTLWAMYRRHQSA